VNHLAHFHLAGDSEELVVGALLGDHVKGPLRGALPPAVEHGVRLHRRIDAFTDAHPGLRALRRHFGAGERRLAGVVTDMLFDHVLALHWDRFASVALDAFSARVYAILARHAATMPGTAAREARRIVAHDLLRRYRDAEMVEGVLEHIGERLGQQPAMRAAIATARAHGEEFEAVFLRFYPELLALARAERAPGRDRLSAAR
jgi:acyl carrier protein phosphodiesterase